MIPGMIRCWLDKVEDGPCSLHAVSVQTQDGIQVYVGGGEAPHVGSVAISEPRESLRRDGSRSCTTSVINRLAHKDAALAVPLAEALCVATNQVVVVTAGAHVDNAGPEEIERLLSNMETLQAGILRHWTGEAGGEPCAGGT
jgi:hypothetical protein